MAEDNKTIQQILDESKASSSAPGSAPAPAPAPVVESEDTPHFDGYVQQGPVATFVGVGDYEAQIREIRVDFVAIVESGEKARMTATITNITPEQVIPYIRSFVEKAEFYQDLVQRGGWNNSPSVTGPVRGIVLENQNRLTFMTKSPEGKSVKVVIYAKTTDERKSMEEAVNEILALGTLSESNRVELADAWVESTTASLVLEADEAFDIQYRPNNKDKGQGYFVSIGGA